MTAPAGERQRGRRGYVLKRRTLATACRRLPV